MNKEIKQRIEELKNKHIVDILTTLLKEDIMTPLAIDTLVSYIEELEK